MIPGYPREMVVGYLQKSNGNVDRAKGRILLSYAFRHGPTAHPQIILTHLVRADMRFLENLIRLADVRRPHLGLLARNYPEILLGQIDVPCDIAYLDKLRQGLIQPYDTRGLENVIRKFEAARAPAALIIREQPERLLLELRLDPAKFDLEANFRAEERYPIPHNCIEMKDGLPIENVIKLMSMIFGLLCGCPLTHYESQ